MPNEEGLRLLQQITALSTVDGEALVRVLQDEELAEFLGGLDLFKAAIAEATKASEAEALRRLEERRATEMKVGNWLVKAKPGALRHSIADPRSLREELRTSSEADDADINDAIPELAVPNRKKLVALGKRFGQAKLIIDEYTESKRSPTGIELEWVGDSDPVAEEELE